MALVEYKVENGIALMELSAGKANTYTFEMMQELDASIIKARFDQDVHVIIITGKGEKFFSAGADIAMLAKVDPYFKYNFCLHANETLNRLEHTPKLTIAAINGNCVGGGLEIAMAADLRMAKKGGGKIGLPEVTLGVLPGTGGTQRLARLVGKSRAIELMTTGRLFDFEEAQRLGIVTDIIEADDFMGAVFKYASQFAPPNKASRAVGAIKRALQSGAEAGFVEGLSIERELQQQLFQSEDAKEGLGAYMEKRKPSFKGK